MFFVGRTNRPQVSLAALGAKAELRGGHDRRDLIRTAAGALRPPKWLNSPVTRHKGMLAEIRSHIPSFEQRARAIHIARCSLGW